MLPLNENIPFELQNVSKIKTEIKEEPKIKEEPDEDMDIIPFESEHISNVKIEIKNEALIREEIIDNQNPKYDVYTLDADGQLCELGNTEIDQHKNSNSDNSESFENYESQNTVESVHEGVQNHKCDFCEKSFTKAGSLKTHVKAVHEGIKEHK